MNQPLNSRWILFATIMASGMAFLMGSAVSIALPAIQSYFQADLSQLQWVVNSYVLALAALLIIGGSLGDRFGRKRIFSYGIALFVGGSVLSGLSRSVVQLIGFQAVEGIGAALMVPGSLAIISASFPESSRGRAIGLWAGLSGGIAALGPFLGGWLVQTFGWQSIFFFIVPIGILAFLATIRFLPESLNPEARRLDWLGTLVIASGLFGLSFSLIRAPLAGWGSPAVLAGLIGGLTALILFVVIEVVSSEPMVPLTIFKNPQVTGANLATLFLYFVLSGLFFFLVLNMQQAQGYSPVAAGLSLLPPVLLITFLSGPAGSLADRIGPRPQMILGPLLVASGMAFLALPVNNTRYLTYFFPALVLWGLGMSAVIAPLTKCALAVELKYAGAASGVNNCVSRIAGLLAVAILGVVILSFFSNHLSVAIRGSVLTAQEQIQIIGQVNKLGGITIPVSFSKSARIFAKAAIRESFLYGFRWAMVINALLALAAALVSAIMIRNPKKK